MNCFNRHLTFLIPQQKLISAEGFFCFLGIVSAMAQMKKAAREEVFEAAQNGLTKDAAEGIMGAGKVNAVENIGNNIKVGKINDFPDNVKNTYHSYEKNGWKGNYRGQTPGTNAGRIWNNEFEDLPTKTSSGIPITYKEFDVNNKIPGIARDSERFLYESDGSVYYTSDHYTTFIKIQ